ncbi:MAG: hypothetical protein KGZ69_10390 [Methylomonas sp.]|nr:hypothetical protein [Methylomonas sp.]
MPSDKNIAILRRLERQLVDVQHNLQMINAELPGSADSPALINSNPTLTSSDVTVIKTHMLRRSLLLKSAIKRLHTGTFGQCCVCGDSLSSNHLLADPATPTCLDCQNEVYL